MPPKKKEDSPFDDLKEGAFTKTAKNHGFDDVMKFAKLVMRENEKGKKVLPSGRRITPLMVKRANFAVNFGGKKKKEKKKTEKKVPKGSHRMPDGSIMKDSDMKKKSSMKTSSMKTSSY